MSFFVFNGTLIFYCVWILFDTMRTQPHACDYVWFHFLYFIRVLCSRTASGIICSYFCLFCYAHISHKASFTYACKLYGTALTLVENYFCSIFFWDNIILQRLDELLIVLNVVLCVQSVNYVSIFCFNYELLHSRTLQLTICFVYSFYFVAFAHLMETLSLMTVRCAMHL